MTTPDRAGQGLKVGMIAPISHPFPPDGYGPWERVCHDLTEGLVALGAQVEVFAPAGSVTGGRLHETVPVALSRAEEGHRAEPRIWEELHLAQAMRGCRDLGVDVVHSHLHAHAVGYSALLPMPLVTTLHGSAWVPEHHRLLRAFREAPYVSLSESERRFLPDLNYIATVGNGIRLGDFPPGPGGERLAFVGRMAPEKAPDLAIAAAREAGRPLVLAGAVEERHRGFFDEAVRPHLEAGRVEHVGPVSRAEVADLVGRSAGLLMPLRWDEPFGLVVVEALAVGTPVVAWQRGAMPELVVDGVTGFLVEDQAAAVRAVRRLDGIDRARCRWEAEERFGHLTMARGYLAAYRKSQEG